MTLQQKQWIVLNKENNFDGVVCVDAPVPVVGDSEVLVKICAASLNYRDLVIPKGRYPLALKLPVVPGSDGAGEVVEVGSKVTQFKKGDHVTTLFNQHHQYGPVNIHDTGYTLGGAIDGTLREYGVFDQNGLVKSPRNLTHIESSILTCAGLTSWNALYGLRPLLPGQTVLVQGTGGVSIFALQVSAYSISLTHSYLQSTLVVRESGWGNRHCNDFFPKKAEKLKSLGADHVINYKISPNWGDIARGLTPDNVGVDYIIEVGGAGTLSESLKCIRFEGIISIIGFLGSADPRGQPCVLEALHKICIIRGVLVGSKALMQDMIRAIESNDIHPVVDSVVFTLDKAKDAYKHMWAQKHFGKVTVKIA